jgi:hypothetical protein
MSYSHRDETWKQRVVEALKPLKQMQRVAAWFDPELPARTGLG